MNQFGSILTGRDFAKRLMTELVRTLKYPVLLDFSDVISLGSSFGDEIVPVIAKQQGGKVVVINANKAIWECLNQIAEDHHIAVAPSE